MQSVKPTVLRVVIIMGNMRELPKKALVKFDKRVILQIAGLYEHIE